MLAAWCITRSVTDACPNTWIRVWSCCETPDCTPWAKRGCSNSPSKSKTRTTGSFAEQDQLHLIGAGLHLHDTIPSCCSRNCWRQSATQLDLSHAFYLGYELSKAVTALTLGKQYRQDEALDWGFLTVPERSHRARRSDAPSAKRSTQEGVGEP